MSHWKWARLLSGNLNMENSVASAVPLIGLYVNGDNRLGSGHLRKTIFVMTNYSRSVGNQRVEKRPLPCIPVATSFTQFKKKLVDNHGKTYPLSSTNWTVLFVSLKLKHLFTFIPNLPEK